ncbi:MAG TPA: amidohydrolase family protein [Gemmatimonadaceae bacterium]|nr:amidohydrolase family protein [Gemmatimonadaceae bacterium]
MKTQRVVTALALLALARITAEAQVVAITGARVYPVSGPLIENGTVIFENGRITQVGAGLPCPPNAECIEARGRWVTPGIFNALTTLGVNEIGQVQSTQDAGARGERGVAASFEAWLGFNPASPHLQVTRNDGVVLAGIVPGGNFVSGQAAVIDLSNGGLGDMLLRAPAALVADMASTGENRGQARGEVIGRMDALLADARNYRAPRNEVERTATRPTAAPARDLQALGLVLSRRIPLILEADRASDIDAAITMARKYNIQLIVTGGAEAWKVAERLALEKVPVIVGSLNNAPQSFSTLGARQDNAALLRQAGVRVIVAGGADAFNARNVKYEAGVAVAFGMPWADALEAITLAPARAFGVDNQVGSLERGKLATLVVWNGDPLELSTRPTHVFVRGRNVLAPSRQDELMRRYLTLPPNYRP